MPGSESRRNRAHGRREQLVIEFVAQGLNNREVAINLGTTEHTVKRYLRIIYDTLGLWNRVELALWYEARRHDGTLHALHGGKLGDLDHEEAQSRTI